MVLLKPINISKVLVGLFLSIFLIGQVSSFVDYAYAPTEPPTTTQPPTYAPPPSSKKKYNHHDLEALIDKISKHMVHALHNLKAFLKKHKKWARETRSLDRFQSRIPYPIDVVFLFDASNSMGLDKFQCAKYFAKFITGNLNLVNDVDVMGTNIGILSYSKDTKVELDIEHGISVEQLNHKLDNVKYLGGQMGNIEKALSSALRMLTKSARPNAPKIVISISPKDHGNHFTDKSNLRYLQTLYKEKGIKLFGVVLGGDKGNVENKIESIEEPFYSYITVPPVCELI